MAPLDETPDDHRHRLRELLRLFLKLGTVSFGGPAAHIAMMEDEVVARRGWLTRGEFLDLVAAANLIPGPNSTELAIHIGWRRAGFAGLLVAGTAFILPAMLIVSAVAAVYVRYAALPEIGALLSGIKPVVVAVILQGLARLADTAVKSVSLAVIGALSVLATAGGIDELHVLGIAGVAAALISGGRASDAQRLPTGMAPVPWLHALPAATVAATQAVAAAVPLGLATLFGSFIRIGSVLFGSGYVLLAFLRTEFVVRLHWLTEAQILDATAVGLITPGPVFTSATFVGWVLAGPTGALTATAGIFLPAFVFVALTAPLLPALRRSRTLSAALDGLNVASLALLVAVAWNLGRAALGDVTGVVTTVAALVALVRFRIPTPWLIAAGAVIGIIRHAG